jgi:hypothetical protein
MGILKDDHQGTGLIFFTGTEMVGHLFPFFTNAAGAQIGNQ